MFQFDDVIAFGTGHRPSGAGKLTPMHLVAVDLVAEMVVAAPLITGLPLGIDTIEEMSFVTEASNERYDSIDV